MFRRNPRPRPPIVILELEVVGKLLSTDGTAAVDGRPLTIQTAVLKVAEGHIRVATGNGSFTHLHGGDQLSFGADAKIRHG